MVDYTYNYRTKNQAFPQTIPSLYEYKNVDSSMATVIAPIENAIANGDYATATTLIKQYEASNTDSSKSLSHYMIDVSDIGRIMEDIRNTQIYALRRKQKIYVQQTEPSDIDDGDVWVGGWS